ncbi:MAG: thiamine pyrophosphate-binding protein, partial [Lachnospiraceae bacterium]|nr:thiamine pyrophosphate-binding protein [Lachnospiraceae bacterium]
RLNLPVKIFVADNSGYSMIWHSQNGNFKGHLTGCTKESGLTLPDMRLVAEAFGIKGMEIEREADLKQRVREVLEYDGPVLCRVKTDIMQKVTPKQSNFMNDKGQMESRPLQDMEPLLDRQEYERLMIRD